MENKKKDNPLKEIKELADALRKTREKVSEPLKPVVKLQETILKINKQNEEFQKFKKNLNPLLNPFAWVKFIKAIKNGDFKKKD